MPAITLGIHKKKVFGITLKKRKVYLLLQFQDGKGGTRAGREDS